MKRELSTKTKLLLSVIDEQKLIILRELYLCNDSYNLCGSDLCDKLGMSKNLLSYHIKTLLKAGLLNEKKVGRKKYYFVHKNQKLQVKLLLEALNII